MKKLLLSLTTLAAMAIVTSTGMAAPVKLGTAQLDKVVAGAIHKENGGGKTPGGKAYGVPSLNPADHAPGGHNKRPGNK